MKTVAYAYTNQRDEEELKYNNSYTTKLNLPSVIEVVTSNRNKVEPYATIVDDVFERLIVDHGNRDPYGQLENDEIYDQLNSEVCISDAETNNVETETWPGLENVGFGNTAVPIFPDNMISENNKHLMINSVKYWILSIRGLKIILKILTLNLIEKKQGFCY